MKKENTYMGIKLTPNKIYMLPIKNGYLDTRVSVDPDYPGINIKYISNKENMPMQPVPE